MKTKKKDGDKLFMKMIKAQIYCILFFDALVLYKHSSSSPTSNIANDTEKQVEMMKSIVLENELIQPNNYGHRQCPPKCGCWRSGKDCPRWYSFDAVKKSAMIDDPKFLSLHSAQLAKARETASAFCNSKGNILKTVNTGGWCLAEETDGRVVEFPNGISYRMAQYHSPPSTRIVNLLVDLFQRENVASVIDFGDGIAQYKAAITKQLPDLRYDAYDGAGNGEEYTKGMSKYADLTVPLDLPVADWVISVEVGEHIPNKFEGMFIRNLHKHNKKGIILSWAVLGQGGHGHVNNHSNEYIVSLFESLDYKLDSDLTQRMRKTKHNHRWFTKSIFAFRKL